MSLKLTVTSNETNRWPAPPSMRERSLKAELIEADGPEVAPPYLRLLIACCNRTNSVSNSCGVCYLVLKRA